MDPDKAAEDLAAIEQLIASTFAPEVVQEYSKNDTKERVGVLLDSLLERVKERAIAATEKAAEAKQTKKAKDALLKAAKDALLNEGASGLPTVLEAPPKAKKEVSPKESPKAKSPKKECIELEQSRNQYLVRLNIGSKSFRFGPGYAYSTKEKAKKEAMTWFEKNKSD